MKQILARIGELAKGGIIPLSTLQSLIDEHDPVVQVDRTVALVYPDWKKEELYPELEKVGSAEFDVSKLEQWFYSKQVKSAIERNEIHEELKKNNLLARCLGLAELLAIQKRGTMFFRKYFAGQTLFGWRSAVWDHSGNLNVPVLLESEGEVVVYWF